MREGEITDEIVEHAAKAFYKPVNPSAWAVPPLLARNMRAALEAAKEIQDMRSNEDHSLL